MKAGCYLVKMIKYILSNDRIIHFAKIFLYFLITDIESQLLPISAVRCHSINRITDCNDPGSYRDLLSFQAIRIALPVKPLVMMQYDITEL